MIVNIRRFLSTIVICAGIICGPVFLCSQVYAANEAVSFGSEDYEWDAEKTSKIGIYVTSDAIIEKAEFTVVYDRDMLSLISDEKSDTGKLHVTMDGNKSKSLKTTLSFRPQYGGTTKISVENVRITTDDGDVIVSEVASAPIRIKPDKDSALTDVMVNGVSVFSEDTEDYSLTVSEKITDADIQTIPEDIPVQISDTTLSEGENTIRIIAGDEQETQTQYVLHITKNAESGNVANTSSAKSESSTNETI